jgi:hypothetical protein
MQEGDGAADNPMMAAENAEHLLQRGFLTRRGRQRLTDFQKRRQPANLGRVTARPFRLHGSRPARHRVSPRPEAA